MAIHPPPPSNPLSDRIARTLRRWIFFDPIDGKWTRSLKIEDSLRESIYAKGSGSKNRQRQLAHVLLSSEGHIKSIPELLKQRTDLKVFNAEQNGPLHERLSRLPGYVGSEYLGPGIEPGTVINGRRHENLESLSFGNGIFDYVISSDVLEHVPNPDRALKEIYRVLKPGGCHLFTVPVHMDRLQDQTRASLDSLTGEVTHHLPPEYHGDPLRPEGCLVFTNFSMGVLQRLERAGFEARLHYLHVPLLGILGNDALVFEARKGH